MGLDASVGEYESEHFYSERLGSYSTYHNWRLRLAEAIDLPIKYGRIEMWDDPKGSTFELLLDHSDCDGDYPLSVIPKLLEEVKKAKEMGINNAGIPDALIKLCEKALEWRLPIEFF